MRTKTLLMTAVLGVASVAAALAADPVYSVNVVGYINLQIPPGFSLVANQLNATSAKISDLFKGAPGGTTIYKFNSVSGSFSANQYDAEFDEWSSASQTLEPGEGAFILNPTASVFQITLVGEVPQGDVSIALPAGYSIVSSKVPQAGKLVEDFKYVAVGGDTIQRFNNPTAAYKTYQYDAEFGEWNINPELNVGEAFFLLRSTAGTWTRSFNAN